jgi:GNAT superfamily N-acetyltransferase
MLPIDSTVKELLPQVADCHIACFPSSLATRLGKSYVTKTLEWFLINENRFLFHVTVDGKIVGYCGGFIPSKTGDGSSSGMLQHAFGKAVSGIARKPWLIVHPEVRQHYPFIWRNIKRKLTGKLQPTPVVGSIQPFKPYVGLVVIAVHPAHRGTGIAQQLMTEFEDRARAYEQHELHLSVKKNNERAIAAYKNFGWNIVEEQNKTFVMNKHIA